MAQKKNFMATLKRKSWFKYKKILYKSLDLVELLVFVRVFAKSLHWPTNKQQIENKTLSQKQLNFNDLSLLRTFNGFSFDQGKKRIKPKNDNNNNHEKELKQHTFRSGNMLGKTVQAIIL